MFPLVQEVSGLLQKGKCMTRNDYFLNRGGEARALTSRGYWVMGNDSSGGKPVLKVSKYYLIEIRVSSLEV